MRKCLKIVMKSLYSARESIYNDTIFVATLLSTKVYDIQLVAVFWIDGAPEKLLCAKRGLYYYFIFFPTHIHPRNTLFIMSRALLHVYSSVIKHLLFN